MLKGTVSRNEKCWQGHPDVAYFKNKFYVVFRESKEHRSFIKTKIRLASSFDGRTYNSISKILDGKKVRWNCPRLSVIGDRMWLVCDCVRPLEEGFAKSENNTRALSVWIMSTKDGITWTKPMKTNIKGIVPDRMRMLESGEFMIGSHRHKAVAEGSGRLVQNVWKTKNPSTPWKVSTVADVNGMNFCEGSICETHDGSLVCMMRENSGKGLPAYVSFSSNNGDRWSAPKPTRIFGCHRPVLGKLKSGKYLVTYREQSFSFEKPYWAKNTFACLIDEKSLSKEPYCRFSVILPLDHDRSKKSDSGYTGWIETAKGEIYIVNYITNEALKPYIKWYKISEGEF